MWKSYKEIKDTGEGDKKENTEEGRKQQVPQQSSKKLSLWSAACKRVDAWRKGANSEETASITASKHQGYS